MSMTEKTGGPAFPTGTGWNHEGNWVGGDDAGMTLRDYFAAKAMQGLMMRQDSAGFNFAIAPKDAWRVAQWAYDLADEMLKARKQ